MAKDEKMFGVGSADPKPPFNQMARPKVVGAPGPARRRAWRPAWPPRRPETRRWSPRPAKKKIRGSREKESRQEANRSARWVREQRQLVGACKLERS